MKNIFPCHNYLLIGNNDVKHECGFKPRLLSNNSWYISPSLTFIFLTIWIYNVQWWWLLWANHSVLNLCLVKSDFLNHLLCLFLCGLRLNVGAFSLKDRHISGFQITSSIIDLVHLLFKFQNFQPTINYSDTVSKLSLVWCLSHWESFMEYYLDLFRRSHEHSQH